MTSTPRGDGNHRSRQTWPHVYSEVDMTSTPRGDGNLYDGFRIVRPVIQASRYDLNPERGRKHAVLSAVQPHVAGRYDLNPERGRKLEAA